MRKMFLSLLLASAVGMPAIAQDQSFSGGRNRDRESASSDDGDRAKARAERAERRQSSSEAPSEQRIQRVRAQRNDAANASAATGVSISEAPRRQRMIRQSDNEVQQIETRRARREDRSMAEQLATIRRSHAEGNVEVHRDGQSPSVVTQTRRHRDGDRRWTNHWRSDHRYDWRRHRDRNRSIFRFGRYYDPYGYGYRRFSIGFNIWPSYYRSNYWLNDTWQYRLPPVYGPYRWVRYYDDALLVDIYNGQVVDVIRNFFW